ncbi:hypothetical protein [Paraburkholderia atlantica]|uniref:hypothetical protein n=1 Tax=Paraburkholderia atlantica TaxID=2654982 RepID=UPI001619C2FE|nr:hypothetical protein [Paraburkholderia atlantica]MBB5508179.1 hypothetical protein [Paraburkholderia atlantica]
MTGSPTAISHSAMMGRCLNPNDQAYDRYGGRGVTVCERWRKFENFLGDMGERPPGTSLDRIDVNGNYEPGNCRWATRNQQALNTRANKFIEFNGERLTHSEWCAKLGVKKTTFSRRVRKGWTIEKILTEPVARRNNRRDVVIEHNGMSLTIPQWSRKTGIRLETLYQRYAKGWPPEQLLST